MAPLSVSKATQGGAVPSLNLAMPLASSLSFRSAHFARVSAEVLAHLAAGTFASSICAAPAPITHGRPSRLMSGIGDARAPEPARVARGPAPASALPVGNHGEYLR